MKGLAEFTKTTLIGGLLVVLPVYVSILLLAKTAAGLLALLRPVNALEDTVLEKIPGYSLVRGLAGRLSGGKDHAPFAPALVEIEDALAPAFIIEELDDGRYTVLVPSVPTPAAGTLLLMARGISPVGPTAGAKT